MKSEVKIILEGGASNKAKGNCFESLVRNILTLHQYEIRGNVNFGGMEIDLIAEHRHNKESLYVECKAKEKVSSDELSKFVFNVGHKEIDKGYDALSPGFCHWLRADCGWFSIVPGGSVV